MSISNVTPLKKNETVMELLRESWLGLSKHALSFVLLSLIPLVSFVVLGLFTLIALYSVGFNVELFRNLMQDSAQAMKAIQSWQWITAWIVVAVSVLALCVISATSQIAMVIIAAEKAVGVGEALKKSFGKIIPLLVTGIFTSVLVFGAFFMFVIPAFIIGFFLLFVQFEVILNNKNFGAAVKRSVSLVARNFGYVFTRVFIYFILMIILNIFIPNILLKIEPATGIYVAIYSIFACVVLGWYAMLYFIKLYQHISDQQEEVSAAWIYIIGLLGWFIMLTIGVFGYKIFYKTFKERVDMGNSTVKRANTGEQKYLDESQKLFDQMRQVDRDATEQTIDQSIEQLKQLNDQNIVLLQKGTKEYPKSAKIWHQLGSAYTWQSNTGTLEDGLVAFKKAEKLEPKNVAYINGVGDMLIRLGKNELAILQLQKSIRITKKSGFAHLSLAQAYRNIKVYDEARKNYKAAIDIFTAENSSGAFDTRILQAQREMAALP